MRNYICLTFLLLINNLFSQAPGNICLGTDVNVCIGSTVTIEDCNPGSGGNFIALSSNSTLHSLSDDVYSNIVNIGFPFSFYGNTVNQCVIGSNGIISFDISKAGGYCPWSLAGVAPLPNTAFTEAFNSQMPAYTDINPSIFASPNGEIRSETIGVAPNRRFIILFKDIIAFGAQAGECNYMAIIMNEGSNSFEFHLGNKPIVASWNNGLAIQGAENMTGTVADMTPGRNNSVWTAFQEAKIWIPTTPMNTSNYTINNIPYITIVRLRKNSHSFLDNLTFKKGSFFVSLKSKIKLLIIWISFKDLTAVNFKCCPLRQWLSKILGLELLICLSIFFH